MQRLKVPPQINQFTNTLDKNQSKCRVQYGVFNFSFTFNLTNLIF